MAAMWFKFKKSEKAAAAAAGDAEGLRGDVRILIISRQHQAIQYPRKMLRWDKTVPVYMNGSVSISPTRNANAIAAKC